MGFEDIFSRKQEDVVYRMLYQRRPDGQLMRDGDNVKTRVAYGTYWDYPIDYMLPAGYYKNPYAQYEFMKQYSLDKYRISYPSPALVLVLNDPNFQGVSPEQLPLTRYFGYPMGTMIARTGWEMDKDLKNDHSSPVVVAEMKIGTYYFANHQHLDAGQFQIYYKGALAIDSGIYQGKDKEGNMADYGCEHDYSYHKRSIAHNTILVYDPDEDMDYGNDGGQRWPNHAKEPDTLDELLTKGYKIGEVLAHYYGVDKVKPDFSYIKGDLTDAYSEKISLFQRSFVFLNLKNDSYPAALVVFDRVISSNENFKKYWLLHSIEKPIIDGNVATIVRTENHYSGQLINTTLLPAKDDLIINIIGGPGHEFEVFGKNYECLPGDCFEGPGIQTCDESGAWRIEISPKIPAKENYFLNVMQVMDHNSKLNPLKIEKMEFEDLIGIAIADRVVFFSKNAEKLNKSISFEIFHESKQLKFFIADMEEGLWKIEKTDEQNIMHAEVAHEENALCFEGTAGKYIISKID